MGDKKKTAVEWLGYELNTKLFYDITPELWEQVNEIFKQALQMEQEQMEKAVLNGISKADMIDNRGYFNFDKWYNETYGGQDESNN
jgi:hypothetical protein